MPLTSSELLIMPFWIINSPWQITNNTSNHKQPMLTSSGKGMMKQPFHLGALDSVELDLYIKQYCITGGHN